MAERGIPTYALLLMGALIAYLLGTIVRNVVTRAVILRDESGNAIRLTPQEAPLGYWLHVVKKAIVAIFLTVICLLILVYGPHPRRIP